MSGFTEGKLEVLNIKEKNVYQFIQSRLSRHLAGLCFVRRWSSPAGQPSPPLHLTFWTNWWDAHLAMTLASDQTSKVTHLAMQWEDLLRQGRAGVRTYAAHFAQQSGQWGGTNHSQMGQEWDMLRAMMFLHRSLVFCFYFMCTAFMLTHRFRLWYF